MNIQQAAAKEYDEFAAMYPTASKLTPRQVLEILNEKAEENLSRNRPESPEVKKAPEPRQAKKPAKTLTNAEETESEPSDPDNVVWAGSRDEHLDKVIKNVDSTLWSGNE